MRRLTRGSLSSCLLLAALACAGGGRAAPGAPGGRSDLLTSEEIQRGQWSNAHDVIRSMRPRWLQSRGPDTILGQPGEVQVHLDNNRLGGVASLQGIPVAGITYMQFYPPTEAAARWGLNHGHGAIYVSTRPR